MGLDVKILSEDDEEIEIREAEEDIAETAKELGLDIQVDEEKGGTPARDDDYQEDSEEISEDDEDVDFEEMDLSFDNDEEDDLN